ncbi:MAG: NCS1 family nucleobase:cation symporter-1 [Sulfobacillus thermotolerans]|uniref:Nitrate reductase n=1 Tax=Sulfobacillus thermotolerans TaxID=338644 RepID=A0ABM6RRI5_9FIRM|nr:nitrate reductase [Sulfobacillus thermotolerans]MCY0908726.1 NCS1 family nucleobase:cation symporter-1 [Sulfobacillus thermotolerans]
MAVNVENNEDLARYNQDIAPTTQEQRQWSLYNYLSLWIGMAHNIPTYLMAGGFIVLGLNWWEAILTVFVGNMIVLVPILLNAHPGTKYGIPFPVLARASFGVVGAGIPAFLRALVGAGWFGIETAIGGQAIQTFLLMIIPGWAHFSDVFSFVGMNLGGWISFLLFWLMNVWIIYHGIQAVRRFEAWAGPLVLLLGIGLLIWALNAAHGFGPLLQRPATVHGTAFWAVEIPALTSVVGFWATLSLNIPDFTRFAKSQQAQEWGQAIGLPLTMTIFSGIGVLVTSATIVVFHHAISDPITLLGHFHNVVILIIALGAVVVATLSVNVAANIVSPAYDLIQLFPKHLNFARGGLITGILGIVMVPWLLISNPHIYIFTWLDVYSGFLGPIAAILIADYWVFRRRTLEVIQLYEASGQYYYKNGYNPLAIWALAAGILVSLIGKVVPPLVWLFNYSWFVGFAVSFGVYLVLMNAKYHNPTPSREMPSSHLSH